MNIALGDTFELDCCAALHSQTSCQQVKARDPAQPEFLQAVEEVFATISPVIEKHPELVSVLERLVEPVSVPALITAQHCKCSSPLTWRMLEMVGAF